MTKILAVLALVALVMSSTMSVSAYGRHHGNSIDIENEDITVITTTGATASTGSTQWALGKWGGDVGQKMTTGVAVADAFSGVAVGYTKLPCSACSRHTDVEIENEDVMVVTTTGATASTGGSQWGLAKGHHSDVWQEGATGNAGATSESQIMVAYTDFSVSLPE